MAYNFYIKRIDSRKGKAITLEEIEHILTKMSHEYTIDQTGIITTKTPDGFEMSINIGPYLIYEGVNSNRKICIYFNQKEPWFNVESEMDLLPIIDLAEKLNAVVEGDEGEVYTKEMILKGR
ncbi:MULTISPECIES: hypothetical protein [Bacillota]|jgi:phenylalanyl-tRNA synthetase beta subunit|uniref:Uncharacterized protein n=2 Tax=Amedibacillus TaxID=2749846 RepID=A0A7G9GRQ8_9FIRM|nr:MULTISPECIES: hypothetical protein [Bacillota]QNM13490.1 hypothetical protein H9Q80_05950 [[Eubacterium] hominis]MCH4286345.1 hypothetical protein [Amedibacillus hominis]RGB51723.1 hypothetical protein DW271_14765 [Absiella sp. AM22-9]RGB57252.1 hypothetical protein DW120_14900 [Absiella sp. AM10-20]RGB68534.1 hypothetical protein DW113_04080 [Absiella sp. AM09-45]